MKNPIPSPNADTSVTVCSGVFWMNACCSSGEVCFAFSFFKRKDRTVFTNVGCQK